MGCLTMRGYSCRPIFFQSTGLEKCTAWVRFMMPFIMVSHFRSSASSIGLWTNPVLVRLSRCCGTLTGGLSACASGDRGAWQCFEWCGRQARAQVCALSEGWARRLGSGRAGRVVLGGGPCARVLPGGQIWRTSAMVASPLPFTDRGSPLHTANALLGRP